MSKSKHHRMSEAEMNQLCNQSILGYMNLEGMSYKKQGPGCYRMFDRGHDSLIVTAKPEGEIFVWNSQGVGGNLYEFIYQYHKLNADLPDWNKSQVIDELKRVAPQLSNKHYEQVEPKQPFNPKYWQPKNFNQPDQVTNYLVQERKLDPKLVKLLVDPQPDQKGQRHPLIWQLNNGNAFFAWRDSQGKVIGGDVQGTTIDFDKYQKRGTLKKVAKNSESNFGFNFHKDNGDKKVLYVFESPIDALSHFNMNHDEQVNMQYLSLNGAGTKLKTIDHFAKLEQNPDEIHLAFDTDRAGVKANLLFLGNHLPKGARYIDKNLTTSLNGKEIPIKIDTPAPGYKDWNEALQKGDHTVRQYNPETYFKAIVEERGRAEVIDILKEVQKGDFGSQKTASKQEQIPPKQLTKAPKPIINQPVMNPGRSKARQR